MPRIGAYEENPVTPRFETTQVRLKLTEDTAILSQLEQNKRFRYDKQKKLKYVVIQFDGREIRFYKDPTKTVVVGELVANALRRDSAIIIDPTGLDSLTGEILPFVEVVSKFNMLEGESAESQVVKLPKTACPVCGIDQKTYPRLSRHLMEKHSHGEEEEQEQEETGKSDPEEAHFDASDGELEKE